MMLCDVNQTGGSDKKRYKEVFLPLRYTLNTPCSLMLPQHFYEDRLVTQAEEEEANRSYVQKNRRMSSPLFTIKRTPLIRFFLFLSKSFCPSHFSPKKWHFPRRHIPIKPQNYTNSQFWLVRRSTVCHNSSSDARFTNSSWLVTLDAPHHPI